MKISTKQSSKLYPHDYFMKAVFLPLVPRFVLPNHITVLRFLLIPVVLWLLYVKAYAWGVPLFMFAAFTDALDGSVARVRKQITPWGIFFDPIADKLLIGSVALLVALQYYHPALIFIAIAFDIMPSLRWASTRYVGTVMSANVWGKTKMMLQCASLTLLLLGVAFGIPVLIEIGEWLLIAATVFSAIAVVTYSL
jgi:CDP-diacylglycerol--glycerol-3-phosphate 3-phosphatidyltransferase